MRICGFGGFGSCWACVGVPGMKDQSNHLVVGDWVVQIGHWCLTARMKFKMRNACLVERMHWLKSSFFEFGQGHIFDSSASPF